MAISDILVWAAEHIQKIGQSALVLLVFWVTALAVRRLIRAAISRLSTQGHVDHILAQLGYAAILTVGLVAALGVWGFNIAAVATSFGLAGVAIGFAVKDILGNFISGILVLVQRPFTIGDEITLAGVDGRVESIRVRDTLIKASDGTLAYVPNSIVFSSIITNKSAINEKPVVCRFKSERKIEIEQIFQAGGSVIRAQPYVLKTPKPQILLDSAFEDGLEFTLKFWVDSRATAVDEAKSLALTAINGCLNELGAYGNGREGKGP